MATATIDCKDVAYVLNLTATKLLEKEAEKSKTTISDTDPAGALKFTIAVVLVYGVGVIGLLGITARRNRRLELMDKEVNKYIKSLHTDIPVRRKSKARKSIYKLISSLHSSFRQSNNDNRNSKTDKAEAPRKIPAQKANSWTQGVTKPIPAAMFIHQNRNLPTSLCKIVETDQERTSVRPLNDDSEFHINVGQSTPTLLSSSRKQDPQCETAPMLPKEQAVEENEMIEVVLVTPRTARHQVERARATNHNESNDGDLNDSDKVQCHDPHVDFNKPRNCQEANDECPEIVVIPNPELVRDSHKSGVLHI